MIDTEIIKEYLQLGFSFVPSDEEKKPVVAWKEFQNRKPTNEEIELWENLLAQNPGWGISIVCGKISGNLLLIDFDNKDEKFIKAVLGKDLNQLTQETWVSETKRGYHLHYLVDGNIELASKNYILLEEGEEKKEIDLKGEGGISKEYPSPGYKNLSPPSKIARITIDQYKKLIRKLEVLAECKPYIERTMKEWTEGKRGFLTLSFSAFLRRKLEINVEEALWVIDFIATMKDDEEIKLRRSLVATTYTKPLERASMKHWAEELEEAGKVGAQDWLKDLYALYDKLHKTKRLAIEQPGPGKPISKFAEEIGNFYSDKNKIFYRLDTKTVVIPDKVAIKQENQNLVWLNGLVDVTPERFITLLEQDLNIYVREKTAEGETIKSKSISLNTANIVLNAQQFLEKLPVIARIYTVPIPRLYNGKLELPIKGYDPRFLSYTFEDAPDIDTTMPLDKAKEIIDYIYSEFAFKSPQDKINAIAHLLTPFVRGLFNHEGTRSPLFIYMANRERAGKDYCAGIVSIVYQGEAVEDPPIVSSEGKGSDEEFRKRVLSAFKSGRSIIHSSNNKGNLNFGVVEALITAETYSDRLLGTNKEVQFANNFTFSLSANTGLKYSTDLKYRSIFINFELDEDNPDERQFKNPDLHGWIKAHRGEILSALFALVREWVNARMPASTKLFASFPEWMRVVGGILEYAGYGAPDRNENEDNAEIAGDKEELLMRKFYAFCYNRWGEQWVEKSEIFRVIENKDLTGEYHPPEDAEEIFEELGWDANERSAKTRLGLLMKKFKNRVLNGIKMVVDSKSNTSRDRYLFTKVQKEKEATSSNVPNSDKKPQESTEIIKTTPVVPNVEKQVSIPSQGDIKIRLIMDIPSFEYEGYQVQEAKAGEIITVPEKVAEALLEMNSAEKI